MQGRNRNLPCESPALKNYPRTVKRYRKYTVDEIIFRARNLQNRLMIEPMAGSRMQVGEVLKLTPQDVEDRKAIILEPKIGKKAEVVFLPPKIAYRLIKYIREKEIDSGAGIFTITYAADRLVVKKTGDMFGLNVRPYDLRRHAATYASLSGTPI